MMDPIETPVLWILKINVVLGILVAIFALKWRWLADVFLYQEFAIRSVACLLPNPPNSDRTSYENAFLLGTIFLC